MHSAEIWMKTLLKILKESNASAAEKVLNDESVNTASQPELYTEIHQKIHQIYFHSLHKENCTMGEQ